MKTRHLLNILLLALYTSSCNKEDTPLIKTETVKIFLLSETNRIQNEDIENHEYILAKEENQVDFQEINISAIEGLKKIPSYYIQPEADSKYLCNV